jgi:hypothetical protein
MTALVIEHLPNIALIKYSPLVNEIAAILPGVITKVLIQQLKNGITLPKRCLCANVSCKYAYPAPALGTR